MERVLVAYCTNAGSTAAVATAIAAELGGAGASVEVRRIREVNDVAAYDAVLVGGPLSFGAWHFEAVEFLRRQQAALRQLPVAWFITTLHPIRTPPRHPGPVHDDRDPRRRVPARRTNRLGLTERYPTVEYYLGPVLEAVPDVTPISVGLFGGRLEPATPTLPQRAFAQLRLRRPGDFRNWRAIRAWAAELRELLLEPLPV